MQKRARVDLEIPGGVWDGDNAELCKRELMISKLIFT